MKETINDYSVRDSNAAMRNKLWDILDFVLRGLECNTNAACDSRNNETLQNYHNGKAQAFQEVLTFFDRYKRNK